jgi:hypothetical protein
MQLRNWWQKLLEHPAWAGVSGIAAVLGLLALFLAGGGDDPGMPTQLDAPPETLSEHIERSDVWVDPPRMFESFDDPLEVPGAGERAVAAVSRGDVVAKTPEELADDAFIYENVPIYLVGRVADVRGVPPELGIFNELELKAGDGSVAYVGAGFFDGSEGDVVYALGRIAAIGRTRLSSGATEDATYFLAVNSGGLSNYDMGEIDLKDDFSIDAVSPSIAEAARRVIRDWSHPSAARYPA